MQDYRNLIDIINQNIKRNGNQHITGDLMNSILKLIINFAVDVNQGFNGVLKPNTPANDITGFWVATAGDYPNFNTIINDNQLGFIYYDNAQGRYITERVDLVDLEAVKDYIDTRLVNANIGFGGEITSLNQQPSVEGMYIPTIDGAYPNFGNLTYDSEVDGLSIFVYKNEEFSKINVPLNIQLSNIVEYDSSKAVTSNAVEKFAVKKINNIAELRNTQGEYEGQVIDLLGYYESGDKESLKYKWTSEQGIDNGSSVVNSSSGSWLMCKNQNVSILDFGIVNDNTIDQSIKLDAHAKYCDENNIYEIDYLNYHIQTSKTIHYTTSRGSRLTGIMFRKPKKIKNLIIQHDKSLNLYQGASLILWLPDSYPEQEEWFVLDNIIFDPYNENFTLISQEGDGMFGGFYVYRIGDITLSPSSTKTNYCFKAINVNFISPAISRNISTANIRFKKSEVINAVGEYWALYTHIFADNSYYEGMKGLYRKDLQDNSSRFLVWTMIHHEPETRNYTIDLDLIHVKNCEAYNNEGAIETVYKHHTVDVSTYNVKSIIIDNIVGNIGWSQGIICNADYVEIKNIKRQLSNFYFTGLQIKSLKIQDSIIPNMLYTFSQENKIFESIVIRDSTITRNFNNLQGPGKNTINYLELNNVDFDKNTTLDSNGILRSGNTTILKLNITNVRNKNIRLIDAIIHDVVINGYTLDNDYYEGHLVMRGDNINKKLSVKNVVSTANALNATTNFITNSGTGSTLDFINCENVIAKKRLGVTAEREVNVFPSKSVTTNNLPTLTSNDLGFSIYDSTSNKFKIWNGVEWQLYSTTATASVNSVTSPTATDLDSALILINEQKTIINDLISKMKTAGLMKNI